jgi:hypothetical protein
VIPAEAVEAAAIAMEEAALVLIGRDLGFLHRNDIARAALEAAAPYMLAAAWGEGFDRGFYDPLAGRGRDASESAVTNPYD